MIDAIAVGQGIARRRKQNGMTQDDLARMLNVTAQAVSKWENGLSLPDTSILPELGYVLSMPIHELLIVKVVSFDDVTDTLISEQNFAAISFGQWIF